MDKETLSNYGWIVVLVLILAVMIALATPFGNFIAGAIKSTTAGFLSVNQNALNAGGITIPGQNFDDTSSDDATATGCDTLYWDGTVEGKLVVGDIFIKISDAIYTMEDVQNGAMVKLTEDGALVEYPCKDDWFVDLGDGAVFQDDQQIICIAQENTSIGDFVFSETGVYLPLDYAWVVPLYFTIPGYTGFPHSEHCGH